MVMKWYLRKVLFSVFDYLFIIIMYK